MALLELHADNLYSATAPQTLLGLHIGTRMTVVRLPSGGLWLHSPVPISAELRAEIDALGSIAHIVCPNMFHHLHAAPWIAAYPDAQVHAPAALAKKRSDLRIDAELHDDDAWEGALTPLSIDGCMLHETIFIHAKTRTAIASDLTENFTRADHWPTRVVLKSAGIWGKPGWNRFLRFVYRDKALARASIERLLEHDFDRVMVAHGDVIERDAKAALIDTFAFIGVRGN